MFYRRSRRRHAAQCTLAIESRRPKKFTRATDRLRPYLIALCIRCTTAARQTWRRSARHTGRKPSGRKKRTRDDRRLYDAALARNETFTTRTERRGKGGRDERIAPWSKRKETTEKWPTRNRSNGGPGTELNARLSRSSSCSVVVRAWELPRVFHDDGGVTDRGGGRYVIWFGDTAIQLFV